MSKRQFVTTLAYQFAVHPALKDRLSSPILSAVRKNPAIFKMSLKRQLEVLILEPLRSYESDPASAPIPPLSVIIDGVDECGEAGDSSSSRSRQEARSKCSLSSYRQSRTRISLPCRRRQSPRNLDSQILHQYRFWKGQRNIPRRQVQPRRRHSLGPKVQICRDLSAI
ncbi:hypothetical protein FA13DRAFT_788751 [Coprinellus micaceus]|uniref:Uncharacterized protein n=1 Tax=Coprinellus micaceus TaxID=71717 RepID=A0A4Y7S6A1_COPMI|nr:hypothetical protein FA13DRAFT_788751 [Coprinellus micaceus]